MHINDRLIFPFCPVCPLSPLRPVCPLMFITPVNSNKHEAEKPVFNLPFLTNKVKMGAKFRGVN